MEKQTRPFRVSADLMEEEEGKRQDSGGASAQRCQGHRHQRLHQDQDRLQTIISLNDNGVSSFAWGTDACL